MNFREIVKKNLDIHGQTQRWLAKQMGISPSGLQAMFNNPTLESMRRIDSVLPLPEAAALLHSGERLAGYVGNDGHTSPEILSQLESLTLAYSDVLEDPDARADFAGLVQAIAELSPARRRALLQFLTDPNT